jgi:HlyD family secretion protein
VLALAADEGTTLAPGQTVGAIDSTGLALQRNQLAAQQQATAARAQELDQQAAALEAQRNALAAQRAALESQRDIAQRTFERTRRLIADDAATAQQLDAAERDVRVLADQVRAQDDQIAAAGRQVAAVSAQRRTLASQIQAAQAQVAQVAERIGRADIKNPSAGTVLVAYAKAGEFVQPGQPLYRIADLAAVDVRAYVTEPQLSQIRLGQGAQIAVDASRAGSGRRQNDSQLVRLPGTVTWISSEAEFTPTPIQTHDERADLVYAIKIRAANPDRVLKIGMPVDVTFARSTGR